MSFIEGEGVWQCQYAHLEFEMPLGQPSGEGLEVVRYIVGSSGDRYGQRMNLGVVEGGWY